MKKLKLPIVTLLGTAILCCSSQCSRQETCATLKLADLLLESFEAVFDKVENGQSYYKITHAVVNSIAIIAGCYPNPQTATAGKSTLSQVLSYSPDPSFSNPTYIDTVNFDLDSLIAGHGAQANANLAFKQNGYYKFHSKIDIYNSVEERNESNNDNTNNLKSMENVIHIYRANKTPIIDSNGQVVYIKRLSKNVSYEN